MSSNNRGQYIRNMSYAVLAGQSGCGSVLMIIGALLLGLWLDNLLDTEPAFTLVFTLLSIPASLVMMVYMVLGSVKRITPPDVDAIKRRQQRQQQNRNE